MTPKEEAKELVNKFKIKVTVVYSEDSVPWVLNAPMTEKSAKQCALICVDEKGKSIIWSSDFNGDKRRRLEEVKQEINKL